MLYINQRFAALSRTLFFALACFALAAGVAFVSVLLVTVDKAYASQTFSQIEATYPSGSKWDGSYHNKAWQCHGFALTLGDALTDTDPTTWSKSFDVYAGSLGPGDILRFNRPHTIMITAVNGDTLTYMDCNFVASNTVQWGQTIKRSSLFAKFGSLDYILNVPCNFENYGGEDVASHNPSGYLDAVSVAPGEVAVTGWAKDPDTSDAVTVHVYAGTESSAGTFIGAISANQYRDDVGSHGFSAKIASRPASAWCAVSMG